jgi:hypothetical protein
MLPAAEKTKKKKKAFDGRARAGASGAAVPFCRTGGAHRSRTAQRGTGGLFIA